MSPEALAILGLSMRIAGTAVMVAVGPAVGIAWLLQRLPSRWALPLHLLVFLPLLLPPVVTGYLLLALLGRSSVLGGLLDRWFGVHVSYTYSAAVIAAAVVGFPLLVESTRLAFSAVDRRLLDLSRSLGRSRWQGFVRIELPLCWPGILAGLVLAFARALGEFGATIVLAGNIAGETRQIPVAVYTLLNQPGREREAGQLVLLSVGVAAAAMAGVAGLRAFQRRRLARHEGEFS